MMATAKQIAWRRKFAQLYGRKRGSSRMRASSAVHVRRRRRSAGGIMARRRRSRSRSGGFGMGRLLTPKNLMFTVAGAVLAPKLLGMDPKIGGAVGGFLGAGPVGAVAGYVAAPVVSNVVGGVSSGSNTDW